MLHNQGFKISIAADIRFFFTENYIANIKVNEVAGCDGVNSIQLKFSYPVFQTLSANSIL